MEDYDLSIEETAGNAENYDKLYRKFSSYIKKEESIAIIKKAFDYASEKHKNQFRRSGEAYIIHPLEVACILAGLHAGPFTICAGLLHDVVEDTDTTLEDITREFTADIAGIVDGVTKINKLQFSSLEKAQVTNHQKMLLAMAKDIRVILVKLADRLHNMRTLDSMPPEKQVRISNETLEIYAPIADKLGMFTMKAELQDKALRYIDSEKYFEITNLVKDAAKQKGGVMDTIINDVNKVLKGSNIKYSIKGRIKNTYSIYKKMISQNKKFEDIYDVYAIRIIVDKIETCYQILGLIHSHYTPISNRFKDYIAVPKSNMYQSLHTTVIGPKGQTFEVQIRTEEMDKVAEFGIAAHWAYKESVEYSKEREQYEIAQKLKWYADLLTTTKEVDEDNAEEFVESIKTDILDANIYVYTPTGEVMELPKGATPIDFAYKIHSNIGNKMVGALVNNKIVQLTYELKNGDIVSIKTNKSSFGPSEDWLNIAKTQHARHKIRAFLNSLNKGVLIERGKQSLERELQQNRIQFEINDKFVSDNFSKINLKTVEELYSDIGKGNTSVKAVIAKITGSGQVDSGTLIQKHMEKANRVLTTNSDTGVVVEGLTNPKIKIGNCCLPIPGDKIVGFITKGSGIVVHNELCPNCKSVDKARLIDLDWATNIQRKYSTMIKVTSQQRNTLLGEIMNVISSSNMAIAQINQTNSPDLTSIIRIKVLTTNLDELNTMIINMKKISGIYNIERDMT